MPQDLNIFKSLCEALFDHSHIKTLLASCRNTLDKRVIKVAGQYSAFLSILFQVKHGSRQRAARNPYSPNLYVALSVLCSEGVLNIHPAFSEKVDNQIHAISAGVGSDGKECIRAICSDAPVDIDKPMLYRENINLECVIKDPLHVPLKVEHGLQWKEQ